MNIKKRYNNFEKLWSIFFTKKNFFLQIVNFKRKQVGNPCKRGWKLGLWQPLHTPHIHTPSYICKYGIDSGDIIEGEKEYYSIDYRERESEMVERERDSQSKVCRKIKRKRENRG